jgi:hypothetical protein
VAQQVQFSQLSILNLLGTFFERIALTAIEACCLRPRYAPIFSGLFVGSHPKSVGDIELLWQQTALTAVLNLQTDEDVQAVKLDWQEIAKDCLSYSKANKRDYR